MGPRKQKARPKIVMFRDEASNHIRCGGIRRASSRQLRRRGVGVFELCRLFIAGIRALSVFSVLQECSKTERTRLLKTRTSDHLFNHLRPFRPPPTTSAAPYTSVQRIHRAVGTSHSTSKLTSVPRCNWRFPISSSALDFSAGSLPLAGCRVGGSQLGGAKVLMIINAFSLPHSLNGLVPLCSAPSFFDSRYCPVLSSSLALRLSR